MNEFCRLRRNEEYGACPDEVHKCALGIPAVTPFLRFQPQISAAPALPADGKVSEETL